ncbi:ABC transporter permease [Nonomuraea sp. NPDC052265]|uniref:ABC transporter permease n=1 Tax=Nonomuraea sp. NPDC052265 TaxID=3364374 RepID=UPI0037C99D32
MTALSARDVIRVGGAGLRTRPLRALLSALGIAIGLAAMVSVVGISASSRAELDRTLARLGTNLLTVAPGQTVFGKQAQLPQEAAAMIRRIPPVTGAAATALLPDAHVYRNDRIPAAESGGIAVVATELTVPDLIGATVARGTWLNAATARYPAVVLGSTAAERLGVTALGRQVYLRGHWFTVIGLLDAAPLAPELDSSALIGWPAAARYLSFDGHPTTIYTRTEDSAVEAVRAVLAATAKPQVPGEVNVSRPSDALAARQATNRALTGLLLGLGAVALVVGGVGVANTMVISVLERKAEIGLRRSLGATQGQIRVQFLTEALLLSGLGGLGGLFLGAAVTGVYAAIQALPMVIPVWAPAGALVATLLIGSLAGLYPAIRASHLAPTEALASP